MPQATSSRQDACLSQYKGVWINDLYLCFTQHTLLRQGKNEPLSPLAFKLLLTLIIHSPNTLSRYELLTLVWGKVVTSEENVKQRISQLRKKLGKSEGHALIQNVRGEGYFINGDIRWVSKEDTQVVVTKQSKIKPHYLAIAVITLLLVLGIILYPTPSSRLIAESDDTITLALPDKKKAFCLDGVDDYVELDDQDRLDVEENDFSIATWVRTEALEQRIILDKRFENQRKDTKGYVLYVEDGILSFQLATGDGSWFCQAQNASCTPYQSQGFIADGKWHHIAVTIDRDHPQGLIFYIDGKPIAERDPTVRMGSLANSNPLRIGSRSSYETGLFKGAIGEINLYQNAVSQQDVFSLYQQGNFRQCRSINSKGGLS